MAKKTLALMKTLATSGSAADACQVFLQEFAPLGVDAVEAIPLFIETLASVRGREGESGLTMLCYKGFVEIPAFVGSAGETIAMICIIHEVLCRLTTLIVPDMQTVVIGVTGSIKDGTDGTELLFHLERLKNRLAAMQDDQADRLRAVRKELAASQLGTLMGHLDRAIRLSQDMAAAKKALPAETKPSFGDFVRRAIKDRSSTVVTFRQAAMVIDALASEIGKLRSNVPAEQILEQIMAAVTIRCPSCGAFALEGIRHLYATEKSGFQLGVVRNCVVFPGGRATNLVAGQCPGCQGSMLLCTFNPFAMKLQEKSLWRRLFSSDAKK